MHISIHMYITWISCHRHMCIAFSGARILANIRTAVNGPMAISFCQPDTPMKTEFQLKIC